MIESFCKLIIYLKNNVWKKEDKWVKFGLNVFYVGVKKCNDFYKDVMFGLMNWIECCC